MFREYLYVEVCVSMMYKKETKSKSRWFIGAVSILMLLAVVCVGSAAAAPFEVSDGESLLIAVNELDKADVDIVEITLTGNIVNSNITPEQVKKIAEKLNKVFVEYGAGDKKLTVSFNSGKKIDLNKGGISITVQSQSGGIITVEAKSETTTLILPDSVTLSGSIMYNGDKVALNDFKKAKVILKHLDEAPDTHYSISVSGGNSGNIKINNDAEFSIKDITITDQKINLVPTRSPNYSVTVGSVSGSSVKGTVVFSGGKVKVSSSDFNFRATYGSSLSITADITGTATLMDSNLRIEKSIPVPNFVTGTLDLAGYTVKNTISYVLASGSKTINLIGPGGFELAPNRDKFIVNPAKYYWSNDGKRLYAYGGGGGGGGGGGSSVIPTYTPDVTPTPTYGPTDVPTIYPTGVPTQQPQSPMPFFGVLAGLGAAALAGVVLRRK